MAHGRKAPVRKRFDFARFQAELRSPEEQTRARAAREICPCHLGWEVFERRMELVERLRKDPSPLVRRAALHVFEDAFEMESRSLPTTPQEVKNELVARRRASRWGDEREEEPVRERPRGARGRAAAARGRGVTGSERTW